jgi:hypothetical protein
LAAFKAKMMVLVLMFMQQLVARINAYTAFHATSVELVVDDVHMSLSVGLIRKPSWT